VRLGSKAMPLRAGHDQPRPAGQSDTPRALWRCARKREAVRCMVIAPLAASASLSPSCENLHRRAPGETLGRRAHGTPSSGVTSPKPQGYGAPGPRRKSIVNIESWWLVQSLTLGLGLGRRLSRSCGEQDTAPRMAASNCHTARGDKRKPWLMTTDILLRKTSCAPVIVNGRSWWC
jgi:hypothetical protein